MALPAYIPTLQSHSTGNHTRVDNVFCSEGLLDAIVKCNTDDMSHPVKMDHYPIVTRIDIHAPRAAETPR
jgi:exonuclease III